MSALRTIYVHWRVLLFELYRKLVACLLRQIVEYSENTKKTKNDLSYDWYQIAVESTIPVFVRLSYFTIRAKHHGQEHQDKYELKDTCDAEEFMDLNAVYNAWEQA